MNLTGIFQNMHDFLGREPMAGIMAAMACVSLIFFACILKLFRSRKRDWHEFEKTIRSIGFNYDLLPANGYLSGLRGFSLFSPDRAPAWKNVYRGIRNGKRWQVFDAGNTICAALAETGSVPVPRIHLLPGNSGLNLCGEIVSLESINLPGHDFFNRRYLLLGLDREAVARTFSSALIHFFENKEHSIGVEVAGDKFIYYRIGAQVTAQELPFFLDEAEMVYKHLSESWEYSFIET